MFTVMNELRKLREAGLVKQIKRIKTVRIDPDESLIVHNPTDLQMIVKESKSAVFKLDEARSIRIYRKEGKAEKEFQLLQIGAIHGITPQVYEYGPNYVVMELMQVPNAAQHMETHGITRQFADQLLRLHAVSEQLGFTGGHAPEHIYVSPDGTLKAVNLSDDSVPYDQPPVNLFKGLGERLSVFLEHLEQLDPELHSKWANHPATKKYMNKSAR